MWPLIIGILVFEFALETLTNALNLRTFTPEVPGEFASVIDAERYARSQNYTRDRARLASWSRSVSFVLTLGFLLAGGLETLDHWVRAHFTSEISQGLAFIGVLALFRSLISLPFQWISTFGVETRYGFNRTTPAVFVGDLVKGVVLGVILGGAALAGVLWFLEKTGTQAWLYAWAALTVFQLLLSFFAPAVLLPLFNKFEPLPNGELDQAIRAYASNLGFKLSGVFVMDGSKRSSHSNAFFTGFGRFRRLVLFDTLIEKQSLKELVAVFAHEVGHFRLKHIPRSLGLSLFVSFLGFYALGWLLRTPSVPLAIGLTPSSYAALVIAAILFTPAGRLISIFSQWLSRKHEFEADAFSAGTYGEPEALVSALKKLSAENLAHLTPHPLKVILDYTHPPILKRIEALRRFPQK